MFNWPRVRIKWHDPANKVNNFMWKIFPTGKFLSLSCRMRKYGKIHFYFFGMQYILYLKVGSNILRVKYIMKFYNKKSFQNQKKKPLCNLVKVAFKTMISLMIQVYIYLKAVIFVNSTVALQQKKQQRLLY